ncbi:hypothetical protein [Elioraea rosea]|uniref:hypothetical protein n=1 Tax=Elioraea rosea TaxID=2492390 RepID=UPI001184E1B0|nr:hypothetical protein [Elioraea rosea]
MTTRRVLLAAVLAPLAAPAHAFRLEQADGETESLLSERAAACSAASDHDALRAKLEAALAAADEEAAVEAVRAALGTCPTCGCGLAFAAMETLRF